MKIANVLISDSWGEVGPEALNRGIGGREGALLYLSREWAKLGNEVTSFVNVEKGKRIKETYYENDVFKNGEGLYQPGYHEYVPLSLTKPTLANFPYDVVIAWECPSLFEEELIRENVKLKVCEMQVAHLNEKETQAAAKYIDKMAVLSDWHGQLMSNAGLESIKEKFVTLPNGVDIGRYPRQQFERKLTKKVGKSPKFVYSSSPDRGLWQILEVWPYLRKEFPQAELFICYGAKQWIEQTKWAHGRVAQMAVEIERLLDQPGVKDLGKIGQDVLATLQLDSDAWLYPLDSIQSTETGCITAIENAAAGNPIITTDCDCMEDEFSFVGEIVELPFDPESFAERTIQVLKDHELVVYLREIARDFAEKRDWRKISKLWLQMFQNDLN